MALRSESHDGTAVPTALAQFDAFPDSAHVRLPVVAALNGVSPATVWRWVRAGRLPSPVKLGPNTTAWRVGDLRRNGQGA
jgi:prophage regulatory protein